MGTVLLISAAAALIGFLSAMAQDKEESGAGTPPKNWEEFIDNCNSYNRSIGAEEYPKNDKK
jgi:hypothetical protein|tara:strand:- start:35 stop:220 length:186 start_codon:yes stop_codon:yes gene_type:complete